MTRTQYRLARNLLFRLDAEAAHHVSLGALRKLESLRLLRLLASPPPQGSAYPMHGAIIP